MEWSDRGLVLARGVFREADVWLRVLFERRGVRTVFAFGGARSRRRFVGCLDLLNLLDCRVRSRPGGRYEELAEAALLRGPGPLRSSRSGLGLATHCLKLVESAVVGEEAAPELFSLLEGTLELLASGGGPLPLPPSALVELFRLGFMRALGCSPNFRTCSCGRPAPAQGAFSCGAEGPLLGPTCGASRSRRPRGALRQRPTLDWLERARDAGPGDWPELWAWAPAPEQRRAWARCLEGLLAHHLGLAWERGRYVRS